jgi:hypothetical protein
MRIPDYWMPQPSAGPDDQTQADFDRLLEATLAAGGSPLIDYTLPAPKWQFLCHVAARHDIALHGSGEAEIEIFEPRQPEDLTEFGNQKAVYAAADGIWAMFFAIVDRTRYSFSISNACIRFVEPEGTSHGPFYFFSISKQVLARQPWRSGTVYLLTRASFVSQPSIPLGPGEVHVAQLASFSPVLPLARLTVEPRDFPFLARVRGHDDARLQEYATALQTGAPWPDEE